MPNLESQINVFGEEKLPMPNVEGKESLKYWLVDKTKKQQMVDLKNSLEHEQLFTGAFSSFTNQKEQMTDVCRPVCLNLLSVCICSSTYLSFIRSCTDWTMTGVSGNSLKRICQPVSHFLAICGSFPRKM